MRSVRRSIQVKPFMALGLMSIVIGCAHVPLSAIPQTRENYNKALSDSDNEQFLLNIVRVHYNKTPYFVNVDSMVTSTTLTATTGADSQINNGNNVFNPSSLFWRVSPALTFAQTPTITYSPLQGTAFVSGMLTPIDLDKLSLLVQSGWSTSAVLRMTVDKIGNLDNGSAALHVMSSSIPQHKAFEDFLNTLGDLEKTDKVDFATTKYNDQFAVVVNIADDQSASQLAGVLGLKHAYRQLIFSRVANNSAKAPPENVINIQTRSFFSILNFLSRGVVASDDEHDAKYGISTNITTNSGAVDYNWNELTKNLLLVSASDSEPDGSTIKVSYAGKWYFIANNDKASKATMVLLRLIYSLQVGELKASVPLITIPVK